MNDIYQILNDLNINYVKHEHQAVFTVGEAESIHKNFRGASSKNLFLRNRKGDRHYLLVMESIKKTDLKALAQQLEESNLSFASPDRLMKYLGLAPGSVSPFGIINDIKKEVVVLIDEDLWRHDIQNFHPNINTATLELSRDDFKKFLDWSGNEVRFVKV